LRSAEARSLVGILEAAAAEGGQDVRALLTRWRSLRFELSNAAGEATDNVKYLTTLEPLVRPLYSGSLAQMLEAVGPLVEQLRLVATVSRHYNTTERLAILLHRVCSQLIRNCKRCLEPVDEPRLLLQEAKAALPRLAEALAVVHSFSQAVRKLALDFGEMQNTGDNVAMAGAGGTALLARGLATSLPLALSNG